nr:MAG: polyprotein 2 [Picornavirales sp.]
MVDSTHPVVENDWNVSYRGTNHINPDIYVTDKNIESFCVFRGIQVKSQSEVTASEKLILTEHTMAEELDQEVVRFLDENSGQNTGFSSVMDNVTIRDSTPVNADLGDFLKRPVRIASFTWNESDAIGTSRIYNPWQLFFDDTRIKYKTNNYSFIQCDLKIKVIVNASPFYYGAMIASYQPLQNLAPDSYNSITNDSGTGYFIPYSQRPHLWIFPANNAAGEMTLPFFLNKNWLSIQKASDFTNMGALTFLNYTSLASANGATGTGVTVQVYAWAENVRIAGPSVGLAMQAKTEYSGLVSAPASAIAEAAKALQKIPIIAKFATATEMGARALASGAHALGFTNDPITRDVMPYKPTPIAPLSTSEISYPVEKLTLDPKNELSIDPGVVGLSSTDETAICHLVQKESYLTTATWNTSNITDDILFTSVVAPTYYYNDNQPNSKVYMTPMCWLNYNFAHWRGDVIFRFRFVASPYHKGRVRISYDPTGYAGENIISDATSTTAVFTQIVDLGKDTDVEIRVPYQQALAWLQTPGFPVAANQLWSTSASPSFSYDSKYHNGTLCMRVLTTLTAPVTTSSVPIMVFVRGADNLEFANPANAFAEQGSAYSWFPPQSRDESSGEEKQKIIAGGTIHQPAPERYLVNFGEAVLSLRQVMRRSSLSGVRYISSSTNPIVLWQRNFTKIPVTPGFDSFGYDSAKGVIATGANFGYNFAEFHPLAYIAPAFIGYRGSVIWHFNLENTSQLGSIRCLRLPHVNTSPGESTVSVALPATSSGVARQYMISCRSGSSGQAITNQFTQAGLSVSLPFYNNYKFSSSAPSNSTFASAADGTGYDCAMLEVSLNGAATPSTTTNARLWQYASIGTDFNLLFFLNVPTLWIYSSTPIAN